MAENNYNGKTYAYIAMGLVAAAAVSFGLMFTILGIYALISSILLSIAALSFAETQKKKNNLSWLIYLKIVIFVMLALAIGFFIGGIVVSATKKN